MRSPRLVAVPALVLAAVAAGCAKEPKATSACPARSPAETGQSASAAPGAPISVLSDSTLPRLPLAELRHRTLPASAPFDDHGIALGGVGSDLYPAAAPDEYWMVTDRGPNGQVKADTGKVRTFPVPEFDPTIVRVKATGGALSVQQAIPITTTAGQPVTGLPNITGHDEVPYDLRGQRRLPTNPAGLDTEGLVRAPNGDFWVSEEYAPSIVHLSPTGTVLARYVPEGLTMPDPGYPVYPTLPAILAKRQSNRGLESLAISPDGGTLFTAVQNPLALPDAQTGERSRALRLLAVSTQTGRATAEYVYPLDDVNTFDPGAKGDQHAMAVSALAWYGPDQLISDERTDDVSKLFVVRIDPARNILGGPFDDPAHTPTLEQTDLATTGPLTKTPLVDLTAEVRGVPTKIEGVVVRDPRTIAVSNDNDFGVIDGPKAFDADGRQCDSGITSRVVVLHLN